jgi:hypothetical protein
MVNENYQFLKKLKFEEKYCFCLCYLLAPAGSQTKEDLSPLSSGARRTKVVKSTATR